jgi:hypothetical protein
MLCGPQALAHKRGKVTPNFVVLSKRGLTAEVGRGDAAQSLPLPDVVPPESDPDSIRGNVEKSVLPGPSSCDNDRVVLSYLRR